MILNFLHTFLPNATALSLGFVSIRWYGVFMVCALAAGLAVTFKVARWHGIAKEIIYDVFLYLVIFGFVGARLFYVLYNAAYFWGHPLGVFKIWQGGIAIHGALLAGIVVIFWFVKKRDINFWILSSVIVPGVALGQAIGRWGNYFNQELFGLPTDVPWGIPIALVNRPAGFEQFAFFHPTFLYESIGSLCIFLILFLLHYRAIKQKKYLIFNIKYSIFITVSYLLLYSALRMFMELLRIDPTAGRLFGIRATMMASVVIFAASAVYLLYLWRRGMLQLYANNYQQKKRPQGAAAEQKTRR